MLAEIMIKNYSNQIKITNYGLEKVITENTVKELEERL